MSNSARSSRSSVKSQDRSFYSKAGGIVLKMIFQDFSRSYHARKQRLLYLNIFSSIELSEEDKAIFDGKVEFWQFHESNKMKCYVTNVCVSIPYYEHIAQNPLDLRQDYIDRILKYFTVLKPDIRLDLSSIALVKIAKGYAGDPQQVKYLFPKQDSEFVDMNQL